MVNYFEYIDNFSKFKHVKSKLISGNTLRMSTLFTIAIPTYNRPHLLEKSINSAINQIGVNDFEVIVVDNGNDSSETKAVIDKYKNDNLYYYKNENNIGMFGNWNRCIELANGKYVTILNDDDWLSAEYLKTCLMHLGPTIDGLYFNTNYEYFGEFNSKHKRNKLDQIKKMLKIISSRKKKLNLFDFFLGNKSAGTLGVLMRTEYLKNLGGYNPEYYPSSDYVLHANYCHNYNVYFINKKMNYYRIEENESAKQETLMGWEHVDNDIRNYFINVMGKRKRFLILLNKLIQENRIEWLEKTWNYRTTSERKNNFSRKILNKVVTLKNFFNF